ncbi:MAG: phosphotransferase [Candidatus Gracilibacteria bacterium]
MRKNQTQAETKIKQSGIIKDIQHISLLASGGFSDCYSVKTSNDHFVLKVRRDNQVERLEREFKLLSQKRLINKKLAPKIIKFDKSCKVLDHPYLLEEFIEFDKSCKVLDHPYLLEEFIEGLHPKRTEVEPWFIKAMAEFYGNLHSITSKELEEIEVKRINSITFWVENLLKTHKQLSISNQSVKKGCKLFFEKLTVLAQKEDTILKREVYNFVQCDPSKENIFITKGKEIKLVDWDFSGFHIFERDLALFIDIYNLNKAQELMFLENYGIKAGAIFMRKLNVLKLMLFACDINWLSSQKSKNLKKIRSILGKCFKIMKKLE